MSVLALFLIAQVFGYSQVDSSTLTKDSVNIPVLQDSVNSALLKGYNLRIAEIERQRVADSLKKEELSGQINALKTVDNLKKEELLEQLETIEENERLRISSKKARIDSLRNTAFGFPVIGPMGDTLFEIYSKSGASTPNERANNVSRKIKKLYENDFLKLDSILVVEEENTVDIVYGESIIMSISETDAMWYDLNMEELANDFKEKIQDSIRVAKEENSLLKWLLRFGLVVFVILFTWLIIWLIGKGNVRLLHLIKKNKESWLKNVSYKDYTFLTAEKKLQLVLFFVKVLRWFIYIVVFYITLPIIFSIFPFSRTWADALLQLIWSPFKNVLISVWLYLPNLFSILVIYFILKNVIRFVEYLFTEIRDEKLKISGFYADWAMPTFSIVKFLLYAFMFVMIFPYLPGSDSNIFKGVSVFIGILFSLGSSNAIANMVAGLVITYMRPFKLGDRIKIGDITGDVVEKDMLVTRIRTIKNEVITIPNASVLSGNTTNYTSEASLRGLIVHTSITIGYDIPWKDMHSALIEAAVRTEDIMKEPKPYVLQTALEDFYVSYQINAYTKEASKQAIIYSHLHQNIQDVCNERGIEILSPHYRSARDGNSSTIPASYLPKDYKAPHFNINVDSNKKE